MMQTVTVNRVFISDEDKSGKKFITTKGKPYKKIGILTNEFEKKWLSSLIFDEDDPKLGIEEGDRILIKVEENGQYLNFDIPSRLDMLEERISALEEKVDEKKEEEIDTKGLDF